MSILDIFRRKCNGCEEVIPDEDLEYSPQTNYCRKCCPDQYVDDQPGDYY